MPRITFVTTLLFAAALLGPRSLADDSPATVADALILIRNCSVDYEHSTLLGAPAVGVLQDCFVKLGDEVKADQVLGRLRDKDLRASMDLIARQAGNTVKIELAEARHAEALIVLKSEEALRKRSLSVNVDYNKLKALELSARLEVEEAREERLVAELELRKVQAEVREKEIVAPHAGIVVAIHKNLGEAVRPEDAVFHVVDVRRVWVTGYLDVADAWRTRPGQAVLVTPEVGGAQLPIERMSLAGKLLYVDRLIDPVRQTCKVIAEADNRDGQLLAGLRARMEIQIQGIQAKATK
jgi:membrane fusion protein, heavy metal efflux system